MIFWLLACSIGTSNDYWPDKTAYPQISRLEPEVLDSRMGGQSLVIEGKRLGAARTVVIGGRNAEISSVGERAVTVRVPRLPAGPEKLSVSVVTGKGAVTLERALRIETPESGFLADEVGSVALLRLDCPIEGWGVYADGEAVPYGWCGADMGYTTGTGWIGVGSQAGFAAEIAGVTPLSEVPALGEVAVFGPGDRAPPTVAKVFAPHGLEERIRITTPRDFARDLDVIATRQTLLEQTYSWAEYISEWTGPSVALFDDESCWLGDIDLVAGGGDELVVDGDAAGATGLWMGFGIVEEYEDFTYEDAATTSTAAILGVDGGTIYGGPSGVELVYDDWSGWFNAAGMGGLIALGDLPDGAGYAVETVNAKGEDQFRGTITGGESFDLWETFPDLTLGDAGLDMAAPVEVSWIPASSSEGPSVVVVEIAVYDTDIHDPDWQTQVARIVVRGDDAAGLLSLSPDQLAALPVAPNRWDDWGENTGYWGEMTIARHQLRKVALDEGDLVVDFIHAINGPVTLTR